MKRIFKILVITLAIGALAQTVVLAKSKTGDTSDASTAKGSDGPGI
jgi:hypothetical protein